MLDPSSALASLENIAVTTRSNEERAATIDTILTDWRWVPLGPAWTQELLRTLGEASRQAHEMGLDAESSFLTESAEVLKAALREGEASGAGPVGPRRARPGGRAARGVAEPAPSAAPPAAALLGSGELRPATPAEVAQSLGSALQPQGGKADAADDGRSARAAAERFLHLLQEAGFVLLRRSNGVAC
ncbi:MAG TPA: hypothetical protein VME92_13135 [Acetobacteraceae bacterium]|nr:hypothetical protein [Acetobacteraceae bacterium]